MSYTISTRILMEKILKLRKYSLVAPEEMRKWKGIMEEKPSLKIPFIEPMYVVKQKIDYPIEELFEPKKKISPPIETIKIRPIQSALVEEEGYRKSRENLSNLNFREITWIMLYERLKKILENVSKGVFTIKDAKDFIRIKDKFPPNDETRKKIWEVYRWKLLIPVIAGEERIVILNLLNEREEPYNSKQLEQDVRNLCPISPILYEIAIESLLKEGLITHHKSYLRDQYKITEKGKVAALLTHKIYLKIIMKNVRKEAP